MFFHKKKNKVNIIKYNKGYLIHINKHILVFLKLFCSMNTNSKNNIYLNGNPPIKTEITVCIKK